MRGALPTWHEAAARDGARLPFLSVGRGPTVVLLPGFGMRAETWLPSVLPLTGALRFVLPDLRGFGRAHATPFRSSCVLTDYAEDLEDLLGALGASQVRLGGISMGAYAALQYQRLHGAMPGVSRYLHIDQSPCAMNQPDWPYGIFGEAHEARMADFTRVLALVAPYLTLPYEALPAQARDALWALAADFFSAVMVGSRGEAAVRAVMARERARTRLMPMQHWRAYIDVLQAYLARDYDMRPALAGLTTPTTVLIGARSRMYPAQGQRELVRLAPGARALEFYASGHAPMLTEPARFVRELWRWAR